MCNSKEEYDLLIAMLSLFKQLGGDAVTRSFPAWKKMSDECITFECQRAGAEKILSDFISELTADNSILKIEETEEALYKGVLIVKYCLIRGNEQDALLLANYILKKSEKKNLMDIINEVKCVLGHFCDSSSEEASSDTSEDNIIVLTDEDGIETKFEFLDLIEYQGEEYVVLLPCNDTEDAEEVVILLFEGLEEDDEESYKSVDNEDTLNAVFEIFRENFKDTFNFVD